MMLHSKIVGSSTAKRRLACPGSIDLEAAAPVPPESPYAAEGTALHSAMEYLLNDASTTLARVEGMTFYHHLMTPDRVALLYFCLTEFDKVVLPGTEYDVEKTYPFPRIPGAFGTGDIAYFASDRVGVIDWKFGGGVFIPAEDNDQMKFLLCGLREAERIDRNTRMFGTIIQPRFNYAQTVEFSHDALDAFAADLRHAIFGRRYDDDNLAMGDHCRFCNAIVTCPLQVAHFNQYRRLSEIGNDLSAILAGADHVKDLITAAEKLARNSLRAGGEVPGYKLVENAPHRKWGDEKQVERWLARQKVKAKDRRQTALLSPAQMEKRFPALKDKMQDFIIRPKPDLLLVPDGDKRPPVLLGDNLSSATAKVLDSVAGSVDDWG